MEAGSDALVGSMFLALYSACALTPAAAAAQMTAPATYDYTFTPAAAEGSPRINKGELDSDHLQAGGPIAIRVTTTPDVIQVVTGSRRRTGALTMARPGIFTSESTLPRIGGLATVRISLYFVATTASGQSTSVDVPVHYR